jgi:hypothetical protein
MTTTTGVKDKKHTRVHPRGERSQGRLLLAFILTLDGVSRATTIAPGWKRSALFLAELPTLAGRFCFFSVLLMTKSSYFC